MFQVKSIEGTRGINRNTILNIETMNSSVFIPQWIWIHLYYYYYTVQSNIIIIHRRGQHGLREAAATTPASCSILSRLHVLANSLPSRSVKRFAKHTLSCHPSLQELSSRPIISAPFTHWQLFDSIYLSFVSPLSSCACRCLCGRGVE